MNNPSFEVRSINKKIEVDSCGKNFERIFDIFGGIG